MTVDVVTEIDIARARAEVAAFAADPTHAPDWYVNIESAQWTGPGELAVGNTMAFAAQFLGRQPAGFSRLAGPLLARAMHRANRKDLRRLKELLER